MNRILITGAFGQIGVELTEKLRELYGDDNVLATGSHIKDNLLLHNGPVAVMDVTDYEMVKSVVEKFRPDTVMHLAAILSAKGELNPSLLWDVNMNGLYNILEVAREFDLKVFVPSSIAAFGPSTPAFNTPQETIQRPTTIYGISKVTGELLCDYYYDKYGVDTRGVRFPGLISYSALPGGGTTDYAVHIFYEAVKNGRFTCELDKDTRMDMMYMPDALEAIVNLMEADSTDFKHRNAFNITAMSFTPDELYRAIKKVMPEFEMDYVINPMKQKIANSWPDKLDDSEARVQWGFSPNYNLDKMVEDMLIRIKEKLSDSNEL